jgi:hypothetical protein
MQVNNTLTPNQAVIDFAGLLNCLVVVGWTRTNNLAVNIHYKKVCHIK